MIRATFLLVASALASACAAAASTPAAQLSDSAYDLNTAARFGRMDLALQQTSPTFRDQYLESHQAWGGEIRIVDVAVTNMKMEDPTQAEVWVSVAWTRMSEATLKNTVLLQSWENGDRGGWLLAREHRASGDPGLFGEPLPKLRPRTRRDVHLPTKSLGTLD